MGALERYRPPLRGEVVPPEGGGTAFEVTEAEASALWDYFQSEEAPPYWEDPRLAPLVAKLRDWVRSGGPLYF